MPTASNSRSAVISAVVSSGVRCRIGRGQGDGASRAAEVAQLIVAEPGQPPDAVSLLDGAVQEPQARDVGFRVHPAPIVTGRRDGAVAALPGTQCVDADPGQLGDGADRVARRARVMACSSSPFDCLSRRQPHVNDLSWTNVLTYYKRYWYS